MINLKLTDPVGVPQAPEIVSLHPAELPLEVEANDLEWQRAGGASPAAPGDTSSMTPQGETAVHSKPEFASLQRAELPLDVEADDAEWQRAGGASPPVSRIKEATV